MNAALLGCGYDQAYRRCPNLWGLNPARLVVEACSQVKIPGRCLDLGCGEGKNASFAASAGQVVTAVDASREALKNAKSLFGHVANITWQHVDALEFLQQTRRRMT